MNSNSATSAGNNEKGLGVLRCFVCDDKIINHAIGPCPKLDGERLTVREGRMFPDKVRSVK